MEPARSLRFASVARTLGEAARAGGWQAPGFRSPPRLAGARRTVRRHGAGGATVAVLLRERPWSAVLADMIEGVVVANGLEGPEAARCRDALWLAVSRVPQEVDAVRVA